MIFLQGHTVFFWSLKHLYVYIYIYILLFSKTMSRPRQAGVTNSANHKPNNSQI